MAEGGSAPLFLSPRIPIVPVARAHPGRCADNLDRKGFHVRKTPLQKDQAVMADAVYVEQAASWARLLTQREARGPGDIEAAWHRLEARYGVARRTFWSLRYRKPKDIAVSVYFAILAAYEDQCERSARNLAHELEITKAIAGPNHPDVLAAQTVVDALPDRGATPSEYPANLVE